MPNKVSFLVLDYAKPKVTEFCIKSIVEGAADIDKEIILLSNGPVHPRIQNGRSDYAYGFLSNGYVDQVIINKENNGCGNGTDQLFRAANTDWAFYVQNDQWLREKIDQGIVDYFINFLTSHPEYFCIDLAGCQGGINTYSERAHFVNVKKYLKVFRGEKGALGGPGPYNFNKYTEQYVQEHCSDNKLLIASYKPIFGDNGQTSIREIGDGIYEHKCDTKELWVIKTPTYKTDTYPPLNEKEWDLVLSGQWVNGTIPENWKTHSFKVW